MQDELQPSAQAPPAARADRQPGRFDAVVIGASAGGVEALSVLLPALPAGLVATVFVVLHLPRDRPSALVEVFQRRCALPVRGAEDKEWAQPGTVYFAPPDYHLLVDHGPQIALSVDDPVHFCRPSIDVLFESAADVYRKRLLGIILTGSNRDGTSGLEAVYRAGGTAIVQHPQSAQMPVMPASALLRNPAVQVMSLAQIAGYLGSLVNAGNDANGD